MTRGLDGALVVIVASRNYPHGCFLSASSFQVSMTPANLALETVEMLWLRSLTESLGRFSDETKLRTIAKKMVRTLEKADDVAVWPTPQSPRAVVMMRATHVPSLGGHVQRITMIADPVDDPAIRALPRLVGQLPVTDESPVLSEPLWALRGALPDLAEAGFGIDGLSLLGSVEEGVSRCAIDRRVPETRVLDDREMDAMLELRALVFTESDSPWAWLIGSPEEQRIRRERMEASPPIGRTLQIDGETVGYFCATPNANGFTSSQVGIELAIHPRHRGRGLGRQLMEAGLYELQRAGIGFYSGVSSRPEVLRMAKSFGRIPTRIMLRKGAERTLDFFAPFYPIEVPKR